MAPGLVGEEKAARGKTPTDVWWHTIVSPTGKEKTGYATQKPLGVLERIVKVHSNAGETVLDFFAGSGTAGEAAAKNGRRFVMIDESESALRIMEKRLKPYNPEEKAQLQSRNCEPTLPWGGWTKAPGLSASNSKYLRLLLQLHAILAP